MAMMAMVHMIRPDHPQFYFRQFTDEGSLQDFCPAAVDDELVEFDLTTAYIVADGDEIPMDSLNDDLGGFIRKYLIQHVLRDGL